MVYSSFLFHCYLSPSLYQFHMVLILIVLYKVLIPKRQFSLLHLLQNCLDCFLLYQFPVALITNYHKFSGWKTTQIDFLTVLEIRSIKSKCQQAMFLLWSLSISLSVITWLFFTLTFPLPSYKDACVGAYPDDPIISPSQDPSLKKVPNLITSAKFFAV